MKYFKIIENKELKSFGHCEKILPNGSTEIAEAEYHDLVAKCPKPEPTYTLDEAANIIAEEVRNEF